MNLTTDEDVNLFFDDVRSFLERDFGYTHTTSNALIVDYYTLFTDKEYCIQIGIPVQDDDFFFHEGAGGMALRIHYYIGIKGDPNPEAFIKWRSSR